MRQTPRLQLTSISQVRLLAKVSLGLEEFNKGDVVSVSDEDAALLVDSKRAERVNESEKLESINRFDLVKAKPTATEKALAAQAEDQGADAEPAVVEKPANPRVNRS